MMPEWTAFSNDPNNHEAKEAVAEYLLKIRSIHVDIDFLSFLRQLVSGKKVLDIGVVSHSELYFERPDWRHKHIVEAADYCLGIDILAPLVDELNQKGFNTRCIDATSDEDIGDRFEVIFIGDVIEHVNNPVALLSFAARHLTENGRLFVATPNPFSRKFVRQFKRSKTGGAIIVNLDHVSWISPTLALEIARRSSLELNAYHLIKLFSPVRQKIKKIAWKFEPPEYSFPDYLYEFTRS